MLSAAALARDFRLKCSISLRLRVPQPSHDLRSDWMRTAFSYTACWKALTAGNGLKLHKWLLIICMTNLRLCHFINSFSRCFLVLLFHSRPLGQQHKRHDSKLFTGIMNYKWNTHHTAKAQQFVDTAAQSISHILCYRRQIKTSSVNVTEQFIQVFILQLVSLQMPEYLT